MVQETDETIGWLKIGTFFIGWLKIGTLLIGLFKLVRFLLAGKK